jgi:alpha-tubulin suppressor-like RCC1 family protein
MERTQMVITYFQLLEQEKRALYLASSSAELLQSKLFAVGDSHILVLNEDGTATAYGDNSEGQCNVGAWTNIKKVAAGDAHSVGLRSNGTVLAVGDNTYGQCNVSSWKKVADVFATGHMTVAVTKGGEMLVTSKNTQTPNEYYSVKKRLQIKRVMDELFRYTELSGGYYQIDKYIGYYSLVKIPDSVAVIGEKAFFGNESLFQVEIPTSVVMIGAQAFRQCPGLSKIFIPETVTKIDKDAFDYTTMVRCVRGSYGEDFVRKNLMNYMIDDK